MKPAIRSSILSGYTSLTRSLGLDPVQMLLAAQLPRGCLAERDLMLPAKAVCELLELSAQRSGLASFGLELAKHRRLSQLGTLGLVLRDQPTAGSALMALIEHAHMHNEAVAFSLETEGEFCNAVLETKLGPNVRTRQLCEFVLGAMYNISRQFFGLAERDMRVCFRHSPLASKQEYLRFFGAEPLFDFEFDGFVHKLALFERVNPLADPEFAESTRGLIDPQFASTPVSYADEVRRVAKLLIPKGQCSADQIAGYLGVDRRTVHRQLARDSETVSGVVDKLRQELAVTYVLDSDKPIAEIAPLLGFRSASALINWYRRTTGETPMQHRRRSLAHKHPDSPSM
jgi:AraC-like DNA-binding protein